MSRLWGTLGSIAFLLVPVGIAQATITLGTADSSITATNIATLSADGRRIASAPDSGTVPAGAPVARATKDPLGTIKGGSLPPNLFLMEKVSLQDFHKLCPASAPPAGRAGNGKVYDDTAAPLDGVKARAKPMAGDDWEAPVCKLASATLSEGAQSFTLTDVSIKRFCEGACASGAADADLEVRYARMAINEKGLPGSKGGVKK